MSPSRQKRKTNLVALSVVLFASLAFASPRATAQESASASPAKTPADTHPPGHSALPVGTILPVVLRTTISPNVAKQGQTIRGQIAQDVPLPGGSKIRKGSRIEGEIVEVRSAANGSGQEISIRFDRLYSGGQIIPIRTDLRAIAAFMEVLEAGVPTQSVGESDVFNWMTTRQIGGDSVFGLGGAVTSAHNADQVIGQSPMSGGVLVQVSENPAGNCRGAVDDNNSPQALWVFSSDACGTYGMTKVKISHAGRTEPLGTITLQVEGRKTKIHDGDGLLLRVIG